MCMDDAFLSLTFLSCNAKTKTTLTLCVFMNVDASNHYSVQLSQHLHHFSNLTPIISGNDFDDIASNDCPVAEGFLQALAHVFFRQMVGPLGLVEARGECVQQSKQHPLIYIQFRPEQPLIKPTPTCFNPPLPLLIIILYPSVIMQNYPTSNLIFPIITHIFKEVDTQIDLNKLLANIPAFTSLQALSLGLEIAHLEVLPSPMERMIRQDIMVGIPRIDKDTLMPKDLSQERVRVQSPRRTSPRSSASSMRKIAFKRRESSNIVEKLQSVSFTEKKLSKRSSKQDQTAILLLPGQQQQHEEQQNLDQLRERTEHRLQYYEQLNKMKEEKEKIFQSKLNELNHIIHQDPKSHVTYNYEGDPLKSNIEEHENLRLNMTRTGIGFASKKLKDGVKLVPPEELKIETRPRNVKSMKQQNNNPLRPLEMPMFPMKFIDDQQTKNMKLEEYRKFYGRKYNRLDQRNHTIDMNATTRTIQRQQVQIDKKHVKDKDNQEQNPIKQRATSRKLALPKLNGKYKVLDRYE